MTTPDPATRYVMEERLGSGGQGEVWRARDTLIDRRVAIKTLHTHGKPAALIREAEKAAKVVHPNVVVIHDVLREGGDVRLIMEYCEDGSLQDRLKPRRTFTERQVAHLGMTVADGLSKAHEAGITHRDIKPANILFAGQVPKITDFGLSRSADSQSSSGHLSGTVGYLPPEILQQEKAGNPGDVFALGVTLHRMLTGQMPFPSTHFLEQIREATEGLGERLHPGPLGAFVARMLAAAPGDRPTAPETRRWLAGFLDEQRPRKDPAPEPGPVPKALPETPTHKPATVRAAAAPPPTKRRPRPAAGTPRRRHLWPVLAVVVLIGGIGVGLIWIGSPQAGSPTPSVAIPLTAPVQVPTAPATTTDRPVTSAPPPTPPPPSAIEARWNEHWATTLYQPWWFVRNVFDLSTIGEAFPFGLLWALVRSFFGVILLVLLDLPLTITVFLGGCAYALFGGVGRGIVYVLAALVMLAIWGSVLSS